MGSDWAQDMQVLISGANGFVGTNLRKYLEERGIKVLKLDIANADFGWNELEKIPWGEISAVVHLAGKAHDLKKVADEKSYFDINVGLTQRIFDAFRKEVEKVGGERTFIYFSSSKASSDGNAYGRSKLAAEEYLNGRAVVLRPAMIHGPGNKGNLNLLWGIAKRGFPWPLAAFENQRSFTSIGNICAAVEAIIRKNTPNGVYEIADDEMISTNRIIELIAGVCGRKARLWHLPKGLIRAMAKVGDILHLPLNSERLVKLTEDSFVDNSRLKVALGWETMPIRAEVGMVYTLEAFGRG